MPPQWITIANAILAWLEKQVRYVFFFMGLAALVIWNPLRWEQYTHLDWLLGTRAWIGWLIFIPCSLWLIILFLGWVYGHLIAFISKHCASRRSLKIFREMPPDEAGILMRYVDSGRLDQVFPNRDAAMFSLVTKQLLQKVDFPLRRVWTDDFTYELTPLGNESVRDSHVQEILRQKVESAKRIDPPSEI
jgi:Super-infection exclusion protein B